MYKYQGIKVETRPISVRLRRDILDWMEMQGINKNAYINACLAERMQYHQRNPYNLRQWTRKNR